MVMAASRGRWSPPRQIDEYRLVRRLGRGAMGEVFVAHDTALGREVALKLVALAEPDPLVCQRFLVEAKAAARVQDANVVTVHRVGEVEGRPYIVSELVGGTSLDKVARPVPGPGLLGIAVGLARGLEAAHRAGVLHRDLKPGNILLSEQGQVKIADFGLAKLVGPSALDETMSASDLDPRQSLTRVGEVVGTPDYLAPELWLGDPATPRTDLWALGAVLHELATGRAPFHDVPAHELGVVIQTRDPPRLLGRVSGMDARLCKLVDRLLSRDPSARPTSATEVVRTLAEAPPQALTMAAAAALDLVRASTDASGPWSPPQELDEYRLLRRLGRGAMGEVFLAHDTLLERPVAVKFLTGAGLAQEAVERFLVEARAAARLQHPNVVAVHRVGQVDGRPYLVSEYVRGTSLDRVAKPMPWRRVLEIALGLCRGLAAAHRGGVLHRDIKPGNTVITEEGEVKLLDFGLAKLLVAGDSLMASATSFEASRSGELDPNAATEVTLEVEPPVSQPAVASSQQLALTRAGALLGTPLYLAPELWAREPATPQSDLYALGALLYELCAGRAPHVATTLHELELKILSDPPPLRSVAPAADPDFCAIIDRCLHRSPGKRFASADELRGALDALDTPQSGLRLPEGSPYRGLHAFEDSHRDLFFGRGREVGEVLERLRSQPFVLVAGDSGVGKSSLCRAGVLPMVREGRLGGPSSWQSVTLLPGRAPTEALAAALAPATGLSEEALRTLLVKRPGDLGLELRRSSAQSGLVVFVDQLEELLTLAEPDERARAEQALVSLTTVHPSLRLLATVRGDFVTRLGTLPDLGGAVGAALFLLRPLTAEGLRDAITGPARLSGFRFESERTVEELIRAAQEAEGGLPLLQFALAQLWEARDVAGQRIPAAALTGIGGVEGALARHADAALERLRPATRTAARATLTRLVTADGTRARRSVAELGAQDDVRNALEELVRARLLVVREGEGAAATYELAHEALIHAWKTLRDWLDDDLDRRRALERLERAVAEWERLGRAREALYGRTQLREADSLAPDSLALEVRTFLDESRRAARVRLWARGALLAALPLVIATAVLGARALSRWELARKVETKLTEARGLVDKARASEASLALARSETLARFDAGDRQDAERRWAEVRHEAEAIEGNLRDATAQLEAALRVDPQNAAAETLLADVLLSRALSADRDDQPGHAAELVSRLRLHDVTGARLALWSRPGGLTVRKRLPEASVTIGRYERRPGGRLVLVPVAGVQVESGRRIELPAGSYRLTAVADGHVPAHQPFLARRGVDLELEVDLPPASAVPAGFSYVPAGRFLTGATGDEAVRQQFFEAAPIHEVWQKGFAIAQHETTYADWIAFLEDLPEKERALRTPGVPVETHFFGYQTVQQLKKTRTGWQITLAAAGKQATVTWDEPFRYPGRQRRASQDWRLFPVAAISWEDARAYLAWLSRTGRVPGARFCTMLEWERAARGADDRHFPHGYAIEPDDANFDLTYGRNNDLMGPDEVGAHPASRSPFDVDDLCGNVWEWLHAGDDPATLAPLRGSSYSQKTVVTNLENADAAPKRLRNPQIGVRVCADVAPWSRKPR